MTCIAWDGKTLAADTLCTGPDDNAVMYGTKIFRTNMGLFGGSGDEDHIQEIYDWVKRGAKQKDKPILTPLPSPQTGNGAACVLIRPDGKIALIGRGLNFIEYHAGQKLALGSGGDFALSMMHAGLSAAEAVQHVIDHRLDINTGGAVETLTLDPKRTLRSKRARPQTK